MKHLVFAFGFGALCLGPAQALDCDTGGPARYAMVCKGPMPFIISDTEFPGPIGGPINEGRTVLYKFDAASIAGGANGAGLPAGSCSWQDRPLNAAESLHVLQLRVEATDALPSVRHQGSFSVRSFNSIDACNQRSGCTFTVCAARDMNGVFVVYPPHVPRAVTYSGVEINVDPK